MYFKDCKEVDINQIINQKYMFFAHTCEADLNDNKKDKPKETLLEHTDRSKFYFKLIVENKKLEDVFLKLEEVFLGEASERVKLLFREMILNIVILHDIGKINPIYQSKKMGNKIIKDQNKLFKFLVIQSKHSILSAVIYLRYYYDYFKKEFNDISKSEKRIIRVFMLLNSYIISRHHSSLTDFHDYMLDVTNKEESEFLKIDSVLCDEDIDIYNTNGFVLKKKMLGSLKESTNKFLDSLNQEESISLYTYQRIIFSLLVASDYYATSEYINDIRIDSLGEINEIDEFYNIYKNTDISKSIREYQKSDFYNDKNKSFEKVENINVLRNEIFLESEKNLLKNDKENVFFLEAPTGSGKSNISLNLSFKLFEQNKNLNKIFYVYPFNTLIEQNIKNLKSIFGDNQNVFDKIAVINSITPIKQTRKDELENEDSDYQKFLLDRQFLNYPIVLTTHVSLFNTMFGATREACFGFYQLANSVIVLDEIQCYRNSIWTEIITFLNQFSKILNLKVIIMSATLPNLNLLLKGDVKTANLIENRDKYFLSHLFKDRVKIDYKLLDEDFDKDILLEEVIEISKLKKKILIEFISKKSAYEFFNRLKEYTEEFYFEEEDFCVIELMTGDDNVAERNRILNRIKSNEVELRGIILVATQVIEAGVDIDMDIGYKDISILDSEEQFMGRINRSCKRNGTVYFFNLDNNNRIYKDDYRSNKQFSLLNQDIREILLSKRYEDYYKSIMDLLKEKNSESNKNNINMFFTDTVAKLKSGEIEERMKLIEDDNWSMSIYLCTTIILENGEILDGEEVWDEYKRLLLDNKLSYAKKQVELSKVKSNMNYFIYQIRCNDRPCYNDQIGDIYCIYDGEMYFKDGKLDRDKFLNNIGEFF